MVVITHTPVHNLSSKVRPCLLWVSNFKGGCGNLKCYRSYPAVQMYNIQQCKHTSAIYL